MLNSWLRKDGTQAAKDLAKELSEWETYIIAVQWSQALWFVSWWPRRIQERRWEFELFHIGTDPKFRSKWTGKQLFDTLVEFAKDDFKNKGFNLRKFFLYTNMQNTWAHTFYDKIWMSCIGYSAHMFKNKSVELEYALLFDIEWNKISTNDPHLSLGINIAKRLLQPKP